MQECGEVVKFHRIKRQKDRFVTFGHVEFENIEGVYSCIRCLDGMALQDKELKIKPKPQVTKVLHTA